MRTLHEITRTLQGWWAQQAPAGLQTLFPGTTLETSQLTDWIEFWIDSASDGVRRSISPAQSTLFLTIHCFSQNRQDTLRVQSLADTVCTLLADKVIPVSSPASQQPVAYICTREATTRNLTRVHTIDDQITLQHLVITLSASVTECT